MYHKTNTPSIFHWAMGHLQNLDVDLILDKYDGNFLLYNLIRQLRFVNVLHRRKVEKNYQLIYQIIYFSVYCQENPVISYINNFFLNNSKEFLWLCPWILDYCSLLVITLSTDRSTIRLIRPVRALKVFWSVW